jgi:hypothetical protein
MYEEREMLQGLPQGTSSSHGRLQRTPKTKHSIGSSPQSFLYKKRKHLTSDFSSFEAPVEQAKHMSAKHYWIMLEVKATLHYPLLPMALRHCCCQLDKQRIQDLAACWDVPKQRPATFPSKENTIRG